MTTQPLSQQTIEQINNIDFTLFAPKALKPQPEPFPAVGDFHTFNALAMFGKDFLYNIYKTDYTRFKQVYRDQAKRVGLALLYGGSYKVVQRVIGCTEAEARKIHSSFFQNLSGFKKHIEAIEVQAKKTTQTKNLFGSIIYLDDINHTDFRVASAVKNKMFNYPIQSLAADLIKLIMVQVSEYIEKHHLSALEGNNIHNPYYTRIVTLPESQLDIGLESELETLPQGNTLLCLTDDNDPNNITQKWHTPLYITTDFIKEYNLTLYW